MNRRLAMLAGIATLSLAVAACGASDPSEPAGAEATSSTTGDAEQMAHGDDGGGHGEGDDGHDHGHGSMVAASEPMSVTLDVTSTGPGEWVANVTTEGFVLSPDGHEGDHVDGFGHYHLYVDGAKVGRFYTNEIPFEYADPGMHEVTVELNSNDHQAYMWERAAVVASVMIDNGSAESTEVIEVTITGGDVVVSDDTEVAVGDSVRIVVASDVADELHVHGYDLFAAVGPGTRGALDFVADIPGVFEVELETGSLLLFELTVR